MTVHRRLGCANVLHCRILRGLGPLLVSAFNGFASLAVRGVEATLRAPGGALEWCVTLDWIPGGHSNRTPSGAAQPA